MPFKRVSWADDEDYDERSQEDDGRRKLGRLLRITQEQTPDEDKVGQAQFSGVVNLSDEQQAAYDQIVKWLAGARRKPAALGRYLTLGGYAGTGKTTLLGILAGDLCRSLRVAFCTLTGKAATILDRSLRANNVFPAFCGTIHRMMYQPLVDEGTGAVVGWERATQLPYDVVVVDEASMLSLSMFEDMRQFGVPIIAVGDHGQLPPVGEDVGLMMDPDIRLETVRRQALNNPIIHLSMVVRQGGDWRGFIKASADPRLQHVPAFDVAHLVMEQFRGFQDRPFSEDPLVLCGMNRTRAMLNKAARATLPDRPLIVDGERVICLKNAYLTQLLLANGFCGKVTKQGYSVNPNHINLQVVFPDEGLELLDGMACRAQFGAEKTFKTFVEVSPLYRSWHEVGLLLDYGYARTVHKAQGSQADDAVLMVERFGDPEHFRRWLYTGVTRASKNLKVAFQ